MFQKGLRALFFILMLSIVIAFSACSSAPENSNETPDDSAEGSEATPVVVDYANIDTITVSQAEELANTGFLLSEFSMSDVKLTITYKSSEETVEIPAAYSMVRAEDKAKLSVVGTHSITLYYGKFVITFDLRLYEIAEEIYTVSFYDWEGNRLGEPQFLKAGQVATVPNLESREGYDFIGWKNMESGAMVTTFSFTGDASLVATYAADYYFVDYYYRLGDKEVYLSNEKIKRGDDAIKYAPAIPIVKGYSNGRWENTEAMKNVSQDGLKFYAVYDKDYVNATFVYYKFVEGEWYSYDVYWKVDEASEGINPPDDVQRTASEIFLYWYVKHDGVEVKVDFPYVLTSETVFYAKYIPIREGSSGLSIEYITEGSGVVDEEGYYITAYDGDDSVIAIPTDAYADSDKRFVFVRHETLDGWCSSPKNQYVERTQLNIRSCDCNPLGTVLRTEGRTAGLSNHSSATVLDSVKTDVGRLVDSYHGFMTNFYSAIENDVDPDDVDQWVIPDTNAAYNDFSIYYSAAKALYSACGVDKIKRLDTVFSDSVVLGVSDRFSVSLSTLSWSYDVVLESVARLFGYSEVDRFVSYATRLLAAYKEDPIEASDLLKFDGSFYVNNYFVLPYAFDMTSERDDCAVLSFIFIDTTNDVMSVWISSSVTAYEIAGMIRSDYDAETAPVVTAYGRCKLFEESRPEVFDKHYYSYTGKYLYESEDAVAQSGKIYFEKFAVSPENGEYILYYPVSVSNGETIPEGTYYIESNDEYVLANGVFNSGNSYYVRKPMAVWNGSFFIQADIEEGTLVDAGKYYSYKDNSYILILNETTARLQDVFYIRINGLFTDGTFFYFRENKIYQNDDAFFVPQSATHIRGLLGQPFIDNGAERFYVANDNKVFRVNNDSLYSADMKTLYAFPTAKDVSAFSVTGDKIVMQTIGDYAFYGAKNLERVVLPETVTKIGAHAFEKCVLLTEFFVPQNVVSLGDFCFAGDTEITSVSFASGSKLESIGEYCFSGLYRLETFALPSSVSSIGKGLFNDCLSLSRIAAANNYFTVDENNGGLYGKKDSMSYYYLYAFPSKSITSSNGVVTLNPGTRVVCSGAFVYNSVFEIAFESKNNSIVFESGSIVCPSLRSMRFNCSELTLDVDSFVDDGGEGFLPSAFYLDTETKSNLELPLRMSFPQAEIIEYSGNTGRAEYRPFSLDFGYITEGSGEDQTVTIVSYRGTQSALVIPETINNAPVVTIAENAFRGNKILEEVRFPNSLRTVSDNAFYGCVNLSKIAFGSNLKSIGNYSFARCEKLVEVTDTGRTNINEVGYRPFAETPFETQSEFVFVGGALLSYNGHTEVVAIPDQIYIIAEGVFKDCVSANEVVFGEDSQLVEIKDEAFVGCDNISEVIFPIGLKKIGSRAFYDCEHLFAVVFRSEVTYDDSAFDLTGTAYGLHTCHIFLPDDVTFSYMLSGKAQGNGHYILRSPEIAVEETTFEGWFVDETFTVAAVFPTVLTQDTIYFAKYSDGNASDVDGFVFEPTEGGYEVVDYTGIKRYVTIPRKYMDKDVVSIGERAFFGKDIVYFSLPSTVKHIGRNAFDDTAWMNAITDKNVVLGEFLIKYTGFRSSYVLPNTVKKIADGAFSGNDSLVEFFFTTNVKTIPQSCFENCVRLEKVVLNDRVEEIGRYAFLNCTSLKTIDFTASVHLNNIHYQAFEGSYWINNYKDDSIIIHNVYYTYLGSNGTFHIPNGIERINPYAFFGNDNIRYVYIPESVLSIGDHAFAGSRLEKIFFPASFSYLTSIGDYAFADCVNAVDFNFRSCNDLITIGDGAFYGVKKDNTEDFLTFNIPASVETFGERVFESSDVYAVYFSDGSRLEKISERAFMNCKKLISVRFLGESILTEIGEDAFNGCVNLRIFTNDTSAVVSIGDRSFKDCSALTVLGLVDAELTTVGNEVFVGTDYVDTEDTMVFLGSVLLKYNGIQNTVYIPEDVTEIADNAFIGNDRVFSVVFKGSELKRISKFAFADCKSVSTIALPSSLDLIEAGAFAGCKALASISVSSGTSSNGYIDISGVLYRYYTDNGNRFAELVAYPNKHAGVYTVPDHIVVSGLSFTVVSIADHAFRYCDNLRQVTVSKSVRRIGQNAFEGCGGLVKITFADNSNLEYIAASAFKGCNFTEIVLSSAVKFVGEAAFADCDSLSRVYFPGRSGLTGIAVADDNDPYNDASKFYYYFDSGEYGVSVGNTISCAIVSDPVGATVEYSVENESVCTVDADGNVRGVTAGETVLTAKIIINDSLSIRMSVVVAVR